MREAHILIPYHLSLDLVESVTSSSKATRPSRGAGGAGDDKRGGLATFRFGDSVISTGLVGAEGSATETVFGVMSLSHRKQQHRYIISYDEQLEQFSVGSWTAWRRIPTEGQASEHQQWDPDAKGALVQTALATVISYMCAKWQASQLTFSSLDALHSAAHDSNSSCRVMASQPSSQLHASVIHQNP